MEVSSEMRLPTFICHSDGTSPTELRFLGVAQAYKRERKGRGRSNAAVAAAVTAKLRAYIYTCTYETNYGSIRASPLWRVSERRQL